MRQVCAPTRPITGVGMRQIQRSQAARLKRNVLQRTEIADDLTQTEVTKKGLQ
jgi:hypothetical protein